MKILIIGAGGMLGYITFQYLQEQGHTVTGVTNSKTYPSLIRLDATDEKELYPFLREHPFDAILNCAALLIDASEKRKCDAVKLNVWLPHFLEAYCIQSGIYMIQVSTDGIFSGMKGCYHEYEPSDAASFYGKSKFLGEVYNNALTVRSGFWGADVNSNGTGLFNWFMKQRHTVSGYSRAFFNGVSNLEFARFVDAAVKNRWTGIYHLCAAKAISKFEFLLLQNETFARNIEIQRDDSNCVNRVLTNTRRDIPYRAKDYSQMMDELKDWISDKVWFDHYCDQEV